MNKSKFGKIICTAAFIYIAILFSTGVQATPIKTGQFSLVQDNDHTNGIKKGDVVATVNFTAMDTSLPVMNGLSIFNVTQLEVIDHTADLDRNGDGIRDGISLIGDFLHETDPAAISSSPFQAFYSPEDAFVGIEGMMMESDPKYRGIMFSVNWTTLPSSTAASFTAYSFNENTKFADSYDQVPEPSALALLSIGLVGFGVARRRQSRG